MVQTIPKLIPYTMFNKGVACQRRDRSRATGKTPGHRVCSLPDCHNNICQGGWCEETMTAFKCHCYDGYEGKLCDQQSTSKQNITAIDSNKTTSSPTTMPLENGPCSYKSWKLHQGSCYQYFGNELNFLEALFFCRSLTNKQSCPIDLVSIHSREENGFAAEFCYNNVSVKLRGTLG
ncbi:versican core protein-like [Lytechinus variegatus]|uniref:versican core protein-like n=1 Tax=Lytechinus variegatus TaxID=7654 RepID=UPI001BB1D3E1|nr:versican core protein-like [Lytechinus variegatus]